MYSNNKSFFDKIKGKIISFFYRKFSVMPHIDLTTVGKRQRFNLETYSSLEAAKELRYRVQNTVSRTGIGLYKTVPLFELSSYDLENALILIDYGIVQRQDFSNNPISKVFKWEFSLMNFNHNPIHNKVETDPALKEIAQNNTNNQKEYISLWLKFQYYKYDLLSNEQSTLRIQQTIEKYGIEKYDGIPLYAVTEESVLREGLRAIKIMGRLKETYFITHFNNQPIEDLKEFTLEKLEKQLAVGNIEGCTINKPEEITQQERLTQKLANLDKSIMEDKKLTEKIKRLIKVELKKYDQKKGLQKETPVKRISPTTRNKKAV